MNRTSSYRRRGGFTLVEMLVSMVLLVLLVLILATMTDSTRKTWASTNAKIEEFRGAREGFETITRRLSDATLNTYWDYDDAVTPTKYIRQSELRFLGGPGVAPSDSAKRPTHAVFFQAPLGFAIDPTAASLPQLLNTWGYFVEFSDDSTLRPPFLDTLAHRPLKHTRFRLMELMEPSENLTVYKYTSGYVSSYSGDTPPPAKNGSYIGTDWFTIPLAATNPPKYRPVAENIVALVILPKLAPSDEQVLFPTLPSNAVGTKLAPSYSYDSSGVGQSGNTAYTAAQRKGVNSKNQLPPIVQVTMVAISESSYLRTYPDSGTPPAMPDFYTKSPFTDATAYTADLQTLIKTLNDGKFSYRVFTTNVSIKSAKWSTD